MLEIKRTDSSDRVIALAGNPNVGKSTVFNALTGMKQHTGNWPGKTVVNARGLHKFKDNTYILVDLPGTYSIMAHSEEEEIARDFILHGGADVIVVVCDATCLERNLNLVLQIIKLTPNVVVCVNLLDEAQKKNVFIDLSALEKELGVPVAGTSARSGEGLAELMEKVESLCMGEIKTSPREIKHNTDEELIEHWLTAQKIAVAASSSYDNLGIGVNLSKRDRKLDRILTNRLTGIPIMLALLCAVFWLTITGAEYPSEALFAGLFWVGDRLTDFFLWLGTPEWVHGILISGVYRVLAWVVAVMLPPMGGIKKNPYSEKACPNAGLKSENGGLFYSRFFVGYKHTVINLAFLGQVLVFASKEYLPDKLI
ncbi:MAG: 50S ribosome-binding GTPase [Oscillospiraceae bacterium]|jgi:ferrous iron transport protein B|nr:50S ribosome-binding GTPase [Oscillospiraceae bacterium]